MAVQSTVQSKVALLSGYCHRILALASRLFYVLVSVIDHRTCYSIATAVTMKFQKKAIFRNTLHLHLTLYRVPFFPHFIYNIPLILQYAMRKNTQFLIGLLISIARFNNKCWCVLVSRVTGL